MGSSSSHNDRASLVGDLCNNREVCFLPPGLIWGILAACSRCSVHTELLFSVVPDDCCVIDHFRFPAGVKSKESNEEQLAEAATMYEKLY